MEAEKNIITVSTEELILGSEEVDRQIDRVRKAFETIEQKVERTSYYWEGKGRDSFYTAYQKKVEMIRTSLARFREQTQDLRTMAGVYAQAETDAAELTESLSDNVIL